MGQSDGHVTAAGVWGRTREHLEQHDTERVKISTGFRFVASDLLGAQVLGRSQNDAGSGQVAADTATRFGNPEVRHLDPQAAALVVGKQQVGGFDVSMHQAGLMGVAQHVGNLPGDRHRQPGLKWPILVEQLAQSEASDQLHDDVGGPDVHAGVEGRHHSRMGQTGCSDGLTPEPLQEDAIFGEVGLEQFDGNRAAQDLIVAFPYVRHTTTSDRPYQAITPTQDSTGLERPGKVGERHGPSRYRCVPGPRRQTNCNR
jgi:hypothetical protein